MKKVIIILMYLIITFVNVNMCEGKTVTNGPLKVTLNKNGVAKLYWKGKKYGQYKNIKKVRITKEKDLTLQKLLSRKANGILYIEKIKGVVINRRLDGKTTVGNYISYSCMKSYARKGDVIITYCVYSPYTIAEDDIIHRFDYFRN